MKAWAALLGLLAAASTGCSDNKPLHKLNRRELETRLEGDLRMVLVHRQGLQSVLDFAKSQTNLFPVRPVTGPLLMPRAEKEVLWATWQRFLDYVVALDSVQRYHAPFYRLKGTAREDSFLAGYAAFLAQYRAAMEWIARADRNPNLDIILNEPVPELGLPKNTCAALKFRFLNVAIATQFAAREVTLKTFTGNRRERVRDAIRSDAAAIWEMGKGTGEKLTAKNALAVIRNAGQSAWLPIQAGVSEWMGDTQVYRQKRPLISPAQIQQLQPQLQPGDVLLERREWYLSNIGLPGFWSHAALYIGTPEERRVFFDDRQVRAWLGRQGGEYRDLEALLQARYPTNYLRSLQPLEESRPARVLEAISEGVSFTTLEHSAACDSLAVLRARLPKIEKARAMRRAFHYAGRPYDFNFDFATDAELVCSELVYKVYEPAEGYRGLQLPLQTVLGRLVMPPNDMVKQLDSQLQTGEAQLELVIFLDGQEKEKRATPGTLAAFRESWKRPKWHVLTQ